MAALHNTLGGESCSLFVDRQTTFRSCHKHVDASAVTLLAETGRPSNLEADWFLAGLPLVQHSGPLAPHNYRRIPAVKYCFLPPLVSPVLALQLAVQCTRSYQNAPLCPGLGTCHCTHTKSTQPARDGYCTTNLPEMFTVAPTFRNWVLQQK